MLNPRYIVVSQESVWKIVQGGRRLPEAYASKAQAICSAIEFAEKDGSAGSHAEVLVRHEDGHFLTEWAVGRTVQRHETTRIIGPSGSRSAAE
jgi:hypothetical protein